MIRHFTLMLSIAFALPASILPTIISIGAEHNVLFNYFPRLAKNLSYIHLGDFPTPIHYCKHISAEHQANVYVKCDNITGQVHKHGKRMYGGNKLPKLQYLLAHALELNKQAVVTNGFAGSNHTTQTAVCLKQINEKLGTNIKCICLLKPQHNSHAVARNVLLQYAHGAELHSCQNNTQREEYRLELHKKYKELYGDEPYFIPTGGSVARGAIGYVQAAFELYEQIKAGVIPQPDVIYLTCGSGGTAAGLLLGLKAAGLALPLYLTTDEPEDYEGATHDCLSKLFHETNDLLCSLDETFPRCTLNRSDYIVDKRFAASDYGLFTEQGAQTAAELLASEQIKIDRIYVDKCATAMLENLKTGMHQGKNILLWNTFCSEDYSEITDKINYKDLPAAFHMYFETAVQPLDQ